MSKINDDFVLARGYAITFYAMYEHSLANLFAHLSGMVHGAAGSVFFRIQSSHTRNIVLEDLLKKKYGNQHNIFFNSLIKHIRELDTQRNHIVHWAAVTYINVDKPSCSQIYAIKLTPPNIWDFSDNSPELWEQDLIDFRTKCDFFTRLINVFNAVIQNQSPSQAWRDICSQPITYPPPADHPLLR